MFPQARRSMQLGEAHSRDLVARRAKGHLLRCAAFSRQDSPVLEQGRHLTHEEDRRRVLALPHGSSASRIRARALRRCLSTLVYVRAPLICAISR